MPSPNKFQPGDTVRYAGRAATVLEVVPVGGRPITPRVPVNTIRLTPSYVISVRSKHAKDGSQVLWPDNHEVSCAG